MGESSPRRRAPRAAAPGRPSPRPSRSRPPPAVRPGPDAAAYAGRGVPCRSWPLLLLDEIRRVLVVVEVVGGADGLQLVRGPHQGDEREPEALPRLVAGRR